MFKNLLKKSEPIAEKALPIRCTIEIHTDQRTIGSKNLPLLTGSPERPAKLGASITLEVDEDHSGKEVNIEFKALTTTVIKVSMANIQFLTTEEPFKINRWKLPVTIPKRGIIAKGTYTKYIEVALDPTWPSSCTHPGGWVKYAVSVQYRSQGRMNEYTALEEEQEICVLNSVPVPTGPVLTVESVVKHKSLSGQVAIPSATIALGEVVPVTVRLLPFLENSKYAGQEAIILWASCKVKETRVIRGRGYDASEGQDTVDTVLNTPMNAHWPLSKGGWEHTVHVTMPSYPAMAVDTTTKFLDITHQLVVTLKVKASTEIDIQAEECTFKLPIKVVAAHIDPVLKW
ncbi:hypothetical protein CPC16_006243 [Podila verticillata]|nr:hypothetical protein CPC16_006243 [Podila verticillata]